MTDWMDDWPWTGETGSGPDRTARPAPIDDGDDHDAALLARAGAGLLALALAIALLGPVLWVVAIALTLAAGLVLLGAAPFLALARPRPRARILPFPGGTERLQVERGQENATELLDC